MLVLTAILGVLTVIAPVMQLVRAEVTQVDLMGLWTPMWLMGFPALVFAAAMAVLFESVAILRGGLGNIVYFFIWGPILVGSSAGASFTDGEPAHAFDFAGLTRIVFDIKEKLVVAGVDIHKGVFGVIGPVDGNSIGRFISDGIQWTPNLILERLFG